MTEQQIRIGTSGYSYPGPPPKGWSGVFYPQNRGKRFDPLEYYSQIFNVVEINSSFYGPPSEKMAEAWVRKTPADFAFTVKLWQKFTHPKKSAKEPHEENGKLSIRTIWISFARAFSRSRIPASLPLFSCSIQLDSTAALRIS